ncbi:FkbM family methyltransferase [Mycolicibacterium vanbaalenii]|uniref:FkbM family methyltransferase n=1 Tax=Mycolicibacterium vanbaalenii TaxID=110539 RepID=UPI0023BAE5F2|nr:FkbM family methyltransferase [Mycolicibacterium vanbaalenii]
MTWLKKVAQRLDGIYRYKILSRAMRILLRPGPSDGLVRLGTVYGGWWVPKSSLKAGNLAYCAGAGEDISFDRALHAEGLEVAVFDPTPRAIKFVATAAPADKKFRFYPVGWWDSATSLKFYAPRDATHVSHSVVNLQGTEHFFEAQVERVSDLAERFGDTEIEIIKMDIEGAEYAVLEDLLQNGPLPRVLCIEFDQPESPLKTIRAVKKLRASDYTLRHIDLWNYTFTRNK